jgi:hypothetical protein
MPDLSDNCEELYQLFGQPEDGDTGYYLAGPVRNRIHKDGQDTGYHLGGLLNHLLINPKGKTVAYYTGEIPPKFRTCKSNNETGYSVQGSVVKKVVYHSPLVQQNI